MSLFSHRDMDEPLAEETDVQVGSDRVQPVTNGFSITPKHALTPEQIEESHEGAAWPTSSPLEALRKKVEKQGGAPTGEKSEQTPAPAKTPDAADEKKAADQPPPPAQRVWDPKPPVKVQSLLDKMRPYIVDENGKSAAQEPPSYTLESVEEILGQDVPKAGETPAGRLTFTFDDLGRGGGESGAHKSAETQESAQAEPESQKSTLPLISDIDISGSPVPVSPQSDPSSTQTIKFTPVSDDGGKRIRVSSQTRAIDLTGELTQVREDEPLSPQENEIRLEQTEFEEYVPETEYHSKETGKALFRRLSLKRRSAFSKMALSILFSLVTAAFLLPAASAYVIGNLPLCMGVCAGLFALTFLLNLDILKAAPKLFSRHSSPDSTLCLAVFAVIGYTAAGFFKNKSAIEMLLLCELLLCFRAAGQFAHFSQLLSGFREISAKAPKRAVKLINDPAITYAMAKDAVPGDVMIALPQRTAFIADYMKHATFRTFLGGRLPIVNIFALVLGAAVFALSLTAYSHLFEALYSLAAVLCIAAAPALFWIDSLPLYSASKKLHKRGAMIAGKMGAEKVEQANAVVLSSEDLFPSGTVTLHNMKVLTDNNLDATLIKAAALTQAMNSPLEDIFKRIANTGSITELPPLDSVKYEERMGISGWVDNELLFIGNRTLMTAHGIDLPSIETDRKILRGGYFPVYVATDGKACALLMVQYTVNAEVAHELRRLTGAGITILVNNTDPNLSEEMICDYLGLYKDMVKVMTVAGCNMYKNTVRTEDQISAPAMYKGNPVGFASIINCAGRIKRANFLLSLSFILSAVTGILIFAYTAFTSSGSPVGGAFLLLYTLASAVFSLLLYLTQRP